MERTEDFIDRREVYETELMEKGVCPECEGTGSVIGTADTTLFTARLLSIPAFGLPILEPCDSCRATGEYKKQ